MKDSKNKQYSVTFFKFVFDAVVAFCLFAVLHLVANTIIWHLIFRNQLQ